MRTQEEIRNYLKKLEAGIEVFNRELRHSIAEKRLLEWVLNERR